MKFWQEQQCNGENSNMDRDNYAWMNKYECMIYTIWWYEWNSPMLKNNLTIGTAWAENNWIWMMMNIFVKINDEMINMKFNVKWNKMWSEHVQGNLNCD